MPNPRLTNGRPSARVVLLKGVDERGFIFHTNYDSRKSQELTENPQAALVFYWSDQERQVCIAGAVSKLPAAESDAYFKTRPRDMLFLVAVLAAAAGVLAWDIVER